MANKFVRVKDDKTGHEYTISEDFAKHTKGLTILENKDAVDDNGRPLAAKPKADLPKADSTSNKSGGAA